MKARNLFAVGCVSAALVASSASCAGDNLKTSDRLAGTEKDEASFVPGQIVVTFDDDVTEAEIQDALAAVGGKVVERSKVTPQRFVLEVPAGEEDYYVAKYRELEEVVAADKNYKVKALGD